MFDFIFYYHNINYVIFLTIFIAPTLNGFEYTNFNSVCTFEKCYEEKFANNYFNFVDSDITIENFVDCLSNFRSSLVVKLNCQLPSLTDLYVNVCDCLIWNGIKIDEEEIEQIYFEIQKKENLCINSAFGFFADKHNNYKIMHINTSEKDKKNMPERSRFIFGFLKCLVGGLMCIIPVPAIQAVGGMFVFQGINDCIDDSREIGENNERLKMEEENKNTINHE